jgi:methyl-accepting chemotaxis protein
MKNDQQSGACGMERRRNYFIDRTFQTRFILEFCGLVAVGGMLAIVFLYFMGMHSKTVAIVNSSVVVKTTSDFLLPILAQTVLVVAVLVSIGVIIITLFVSHKIAGPLFHLKKAMEKLGGGDFTVRMHLRQNDQLKEIADSFNDMAGKMEKRCSH